MAIANLFSSDSFLTFDQLSWSLSTLIAFSVIIHAFLGRDGHSLMHPILLGKQSELARVRRKSESPIVTSTGSMFGLLPVSPQRSIGSLLDLLTASKGKLQPADNEYFLPSNVPLESLVSEARKQLWSILAHSDTLEDQTHPRLLLLCSNPELRLVLTLAAATLPLVSIIVGSSNHSGTIPIEVQTAFQRFIPHISLVVYDKGSPEGVKEIFASNAQVKTLSGHQVTNWFKSQTLDKSISDIPTDFKHTRILMIDQPTTSDDRKVAVQIFSFTPDNLLAGITASLGLFPLTSKLTSTDRVALEMDCDSHWGYQLSLAAAAAYAGADVSFFNNLNSVVGWEPTVLVIKPSTSQALARKVVDCNRQSIFTKLAVGRRLFFLSNGTLIGPLANAASWVGPKVRAIFTNGAVSQSSVNLIRAGIGCSFQRVYSHPLAAGPILASQPYDFQMLQSPKSAIHCGPPTVNVECKVIGVPEPAILNSDAVKGELVIRGPSLAQEVFDGVSNQNLISQLEASEGFSKVEEVVELMPNGTIRIHSASLAWDY